MARSKVLVRYGASHAQLVIGTLGNDPITQQGFADYLGGVDKFAVHDGEIEHHGDDDVKESKFDEFSANNNVLALTSGGFFESAPSWVMEIPDAGTDTTFWSINKAFRGALVAAWGSDKTWSVERAFFPAGEVDGVRIDRFCDIYRRTPTKG